MFSLLVISGLQLAANTLTPTGSAEAIRLSSGDTAHRITAEGITFGLVGPANIVLEVRARAEGNASVVIVRNSEEHSRNELAFRRKSGDDTELPFVVKLALDVPAGSHVYTVRSGDDLAIVARKVKRVPKKTTVVVFAPYTEGDPPEERAAAVEEPKTDAADSADELASAEPTETSETTVAAATAAPAPQAPPRAQAAPESAPQETKKFTIAVMDLTAGPGVDRDLVIALGNTITQELEGLGIFAAISTNEIRQMIQAEEVRQTAGCDTVTCLAEIAGTMGAEYTVLGGVLKLGETFLLQLQIVDTRHARAINRVQREYDGKPAGLFTEAQAAAKMLVRDLMALKGGNLDLKISETGASVKVDGVIVGVSPMPPFQVSGGIHTVAVEKEGFVRYAKDLDVKEKRTTGADILLQPSAEYKAAYLERANRTRTLAWAGIAGGGASLAAAVAFGVYSGIATGALNEDIRAYNADVTQQRTATAAALEARAGEIRGFNAGFWIALPIGVGALTAGIIAYVTGDDPSHFDAVTEVGVEPEIAATTGIDTLFFGPGTVSLSGRF